MMTTKEITMCGGRLIEVVGEVDLTLLLTQNSRMFTNLGAPMKLLSLLPIKYSESHLDAVIN